MSAAQRYNSRVIHFSTIQEAKDFLANRIVAEAQRENVPLSEIERKLLYFSETDWTLPDMKQVGAEFDRDYDQHEYEQKIARLIAHIIVDRHHQNENEEKKWDAAVEKLGEGDHYLSVLIGNVHLSGGGFVPTFCKPTIRPPHDGLKLWLTAFAIVFGLVGLMVVGNSIGGPGRAAVDWIFERNHIGLLVLVALGVWFLWSIRGNLRIILKGLLRRS